jgi:hypothetical protein
VGYADPQQVARLFEKSFAVTGVRRPGSTSTR